MKIIFSILVSLIAFSAVSASFEIGESDFLLDGKPLKIHCGEVHYARIPRPYWRHRLQMLKALGMNAVGCYMFWNYHEREPGKFTWTDRADAATFCRMAQEEGLWVILRPGPYACAEWEGGGAPAWLLKDDSISMRSSDPKWTEPAKRWIAEVGRVLAPLQVSRGGPILMVQVENEYGLHGNDAAYIEYLRRATIAAGFEVPLYACNPPRVIKNGFNDKLFQAANFGADPEQRFNIVREVQPKGPMMCSEYYPAWFDTWGARHNGPKRDKDFFGPIDWMLDHGASFSLYMAHGGTSFGGWTGCRNPFVPNVTSYDYAAPIDEQGRPNPSFFKLRDRLAKYLNPGETLGKMPDPIPVKAFGEVPLTHVASVMAYMTALTNVFPRPIYSEKLDLPFGLVAWETTIPAGLNGDLAVENIHDFGYTFLNGVRLGTFDRRHRGVKLPIAAADAPRTLTIIVEAMGRINSSQGMEDRKGLSDRVTLGGMELTNWTAKVLPINPDRIDRLEPLGRVEPFEQHPSVYCGTLNVSDPADTFLDLRGFTKGIVFVNGWNLGRYWKIGPQQTLFLPGCWLKKGANEITVIEMFAPTESVIRSLAEPVLDELHPEADFNRASREVKKFPGGTEVVSGEFPNTDAAQVVMLKDPVTVAQFTLQALSSHDRDTKKPFVSIGEFDLLDEKGNPITDADLTIAGVDSEEEISQDGVAENAIDGQVESYWYATSRSLPHWIAFKAAKPVNIHGFRYTPCVQNRGRIKCWKFFTASALPPEADPAAVSRKISELFLTTEPERYKPVGFNDRGYLKGDGYGRGKIVQYSVVSLWANAMDCARKTGNTNLQERLVRRFDEYRKGGARHHICSRPYHVDDAIFGAVPYEIYLHTGDETCLEMGNWYADTQWAAPSDASVKTRENLPREEQEKLYAGGYSPATRFWIDDMYMITALQSQAFRATGDVKYIERAAKEMCLYLDKLQLKEGPAKGLFYHAPDTPYVWGRGDGWMAAGMALVLAHLPETSPHRARIMDGYRQMMATLLKYQRPDGFWCQLVDRPDDSRNWPEASGTAMFAYAYLMGVTRGWLDAATYEEPALRAWVALCKTLDEHGNVPNTCCGTSKKNNLEYYFNRTKVDGDPHAQAPMLWCAGVLLERKQTAPLVADRPRVGGFWGEKFKMLTCKWLPHCIREMETGAGKEMQNFTGKRFRGCKWADAYPYNVVEAACLALEIDPGDDAEWQAGQDFLRRKVDEWIPIFLSAQEATGYIDNYTRLRNARHYRNVGDHEFYVQGYFIEMGVAHYRMTGGSDRRLLDAAIRCADGIDVIFGPPPKRTWLNGHPGLEMALQRLADAAGQEKYRTLARYFVLHQSEGGEKDGYNQSDRPAAEMSEPTGHAVRANYFYAAMARIPETKDAALRIFNSIVDRRMYLTGGVGSDYRKEAYGAPYDLPQLAYAESCAGCGLAFLSRAIAPWAEREKCEAVYERVLYNNVLGAVARDGGTFWYQNPLASNKPRTSWHGCPCCVGNIPRTLFALKDNLARVENGTLYIDHYMEIENLRVGDYTLSMKTGYPWNGEVSVETDFPGKIVARFPWRDESALYTARPEVAHGYREVGKTFALPMPDQTVTADARVASCAGRVAYQTGPIVWSWETYWADDPQKPSKPHSADSPKRVLNFDRLNDGGYAEVWRPDPSVAREIPPPSPLLPGFHPDPSVCKGPDGAYYLVTSSFMWNPGLPIYRSTNFRDWKLIGHALPDFSALPTGPDDKDDDGVWAPTIRFHDGVFYLVFTFSGNGEKVNCLMTAPQPEGPWSAPRVVKGCPGNGGIDPSLFFDDDGRVYWQANRMMSNEEKKWGAQCMTYVQRIDLEKAELIGERHDLSTGVFHGAKFCEGPHLYKFGKTYYLGHAEGGTQFDHAATMKESQRVTGPFRPTRTNPLVTRRDRGRGNGLHCAGHLDLVQEKGNDYLSVFLGTRVYGPDHRTLLGRETFACPVLYRDGDFIVRDDQLIAGTVDEGDTWYTVATPGANVRLKRLLGYAFDVTVEVPTKASAVLFRNVKGYEAWPNETDSVQRIRLVSADGLTVQASRDGKPLGPARDLARLCEAAKVSRFNGPGYGVLQTP